ncbi:Protein FRA10AC1-like protein [Armadillidium vulgare]|nr:Protein FRA10AC1-like protein [Armadillidium vulgare]
MFTSFEVGMRWRTEAEVIDGKGQFTCGEKHCPEKENLRTWEMNFGYIEEGVKKNALVKLRLCHDCSYKINYKHKRKEIKKLKKQKYIDKTTHKRVKLNDDVENVSDEDSNAGDEKVEGRNKQQLQQKIFGRNLQRLRRKIERKNLKNICKICFCDLDLLKIF